ncbi:MAG: InlB B-repeat-containing protein, partial [Lachnospiraceae bacterium]
NILSYTATANATYIARFQRVEVIETVIQTYKRQVANGATWEETTNNSIGTVTPGSLTCEVGEPAGSTATAGTGYEFVGWYDEEGNAVANSMLGDERNILSYIATANATYIARFQRVEVTENVTQIFIRQIKVGGTWTTTTDDEVGTLTHYTHMDVVGATATSTAAAGTGYEFVGWYDEEGHAVADTMLSDGGKSIIYTTTEDTTYYARFEKIMVTQTYKREVKNGATWEETTNNSVGTVTPGSLTCEVGKPAGSTATAGTGYEFVGWYDEEGNAVADTMLGAESNILSYTATANVTYIARFQREEVIDPVTQTYKRQVKNGDVWENTIDDQIGTVTPGSLTCEVGEPAGSTAAAGTGYEFVGSYDEEGNAVADTMLGAESNILSYTATANATYIARFQRVEVTETITQTFIRQIKVDGTWTTTTDDEVGTLTYYTHTDVVGATATSTATAGTGYEFVGWYDEEENAVADTMLSDGGKTISYTTTGAATYYARFQREEAIETVTQTFIRQVKEGDNWKYTTDNTIGTLDCYTHVDVVGRTVSVTVTVGAGYEFIGWYNRAGEKVAADMLSNNGMTLSYTTTGNATYYARFQKDESAETVTQTFVRRIKNRAAWINTEDDRVGILTCYTHTDVEGTKVSSTAQAGAGYEFVGWYDASGNAVVDTMLSSDKKTIIYTTTGDATYYAHFQRVEVVEQVTQTFIRQIKNDEAWDITTDDNVGTLTCYTHTDVAGKGVSSTAQEGEGYVFVGWYDENGNAVADTMLSSDKKTIIYTTTGDATYYARFRSTAISGNPPVTDASTETDTNSDSNIESGNRESATGDQSNPVLWTTLLFMSMVAMAVLFTKRNKYN